MVNGSWLMAQGWLGAQPGPRGCRGEVGGVGGGWVGGAAAAPINELFDYIS